MKKLKIAGIILVIVAAIVISTMAYCYARVEESLGYPWGMWIGAGRLSEEPTSYTEVPDDVDKWTKKALENPGEWVYAEDQQCWARGHIGVPVKYKDEYYALGILWRDGPPGSDVSIEKKVLSYAPAGFIGLCALGAVLGVVWYKTEREKSAEKGVV